MMASPWARADHLTRLQAEPQCDVLVIGAGIVGAGIAQDAAGRGMSVVVVDRSDFGSGTSSRSTKLLHGGIRYLPQFRFGLVAEGLREQRVLSRTADYLAEPLEFVIPIYKGRGFGDVPRWLRNPFVFMVALRLGLLFYDFAGGRLFGSGRRYRHRVVGPEEALRLAPGLRSKGLKRAFLYHDYQTDDARLTLAALQTAVRAGACALNWAEVTATEPTADGEHLVRLRDRLGGIEMTVRTRVVVAATGAFAPPRSNGAATLPVVRSKGIHLTARATDVGITDRAVVLPETEDERVLYIIPWQGWAVIGTTDTPYEGDTAHPTADETDVSYLKRHVHAYMDVTEFEPVSTWAGLRALVDTDGSTARASREHKVVVAAPGYLQVAGGKLTGYRRIAAGVVDRVAKHLGVRARSRTSRTRLVGAGGGTDPDVVVAQRCADLGLPAGYGTMLQRRYGTHASGVLDLLDAEPYLRQLLGDGSTLGEVVWAARHESAATISDFTLRRGRLSWFTEDHGRHDAESIATALATELGWDDAELTRQLAAFEEELRSEGL